MADSILKVAGDGDAPWQVAYRERLADEIRHNLEVVGPEAVIGRSQFPCPFPAKRGASPPAPLK